MELFLLLVAEDTVCGSGREGGRAVAAVSGRGEEERDSDEVSERGCALLMLILMEGGAIPSELW
jgi:hypothetical protein